MSLRHSIQMFSAIGLSTPIFKQIIARHRSSWLSPIAQSTRQALRFLEAITDVAGRTIPKDEHLMATLHATKTHGWWNHHCPTRQSVWAWLPPTSIKVPGKLLQSMSGIHYNMEPEKLGSVTFWAKPVPVNGPLLKTIPILSWPRTFYAIAGCWPTFTGLRQ